MGETYIFQIFPNPVPRPEVVFRGLGAVAGTAVQHPTENLVMRQREATASAAAGGNVVEEDSLYELSTLLAMWIRALEWQLYIFTLPCCPEGVLLSPGV